MVDIVQKLPYGIETGKAERYIEITCKCCGLINDIETWMFSCFFEMNCGHCRAPLNLEIYRKRK